MSTKTETKKGLSENFDLPIFFIVCAGRSGSTLLQLMMDSHPHVSVPLESRFIIFLYRKYAFRKKWDQNGLQEFYNDLLLEEKIIHLWKMDLEKLKKDILQQPENTTFARLCKIVFQNYISFFKKGKIQILGDKNPVNSLFVSELSQLFPKAKFIHLVRDPRASALSHVKAHIHSNVVGASFTWRDYNRSILQIKKSCPERFFTLKYEDLVFQTEHWLAKMTDFLGVNFFSGMLDYHKNIGHFINVSGKNGSLIHKYHKNVLKSIDASLMNNWINSLTQDQVQQIEYITKREMKLNGYEAVGNFKGRNSFWTQKAKAVLLKNIIRFYYLKIPFFWRKSYSSINPKLRPKLFYNVEWK